jgi:6-pyruvoyltetrahydropterin/6-carboxytetrahydropterin synthase
MISNREGRGVYEVVVKKSFSAAHILQEIGGKCENLHGHNFVVEVAVASHDLNAEGLLIDFRILKKWTDEILKELDHKYLNELKAFERMNPSSERIAKFIFDRISKKARRHHVEVSRVTVWESENARVSYDGNTR